MEYPEFLNRVPYDVTVKYDDYTRKIEPKFAGCLLNKDAFCRLFSDVYREVAVCVEKGFVKNEDLVSETMRGMEKYICA